MTVAGLLGVFSLQSMRRLPGQTWIRSGAGSERIGRRISWIGEGIRKPHGGGRKRLEVSVDGKEGKSEGRVMLVGSLVQVIAELLRLIRELEG